MAYPEDYPDDLTKAKAQGYLHKHMRVLADGLTGMPVYNPGTALGADLLAWWDASHTSRIIGSPGVSTWLDAVAGYNLVQATPAAQPVYSATNFGGAPGLMFDGVDDFLNMESVPFPTGAAPSEVWGLVQNDMDAADTTTRNFVGYGGNGVSVSTGVRRIFRTVTTGINRAGAGTGLSPSGSVSVTNTSVDFSRRHVVRVIFGATETTTYVDGIPEGPTAAVPGTLALRFRVGGSLITIPTLFWQGPIAAILVTNPLSAAKATGLHNYLMARRKV